jgi:hypothetical protein
MSAPAASQVSAARDGQDDCGGEPLPKGVDARLARLPGRLGAWRYPHASKCVSLPLIGELRGKMVAMVLLRQETQDKFEDVKTYYLALLPGADSAVTVKQSKKRLEIKANDETVLVLNQGDRVAIQYNVFVPGDVVTIGK